jgi:signal transduction histidine kinase/CheY-like chemotaxis protein
MADATDSRVAGPRTLAGSRRTWQFIVGVFALATAILGLGAVSFAAFQRAVGVEQLRLDADASARNGYEALLAAEQAFDTLQDAERSQRGYVLTENPVFLEPYRQAIAEEPRAFGRLRALVDNTEPAQLQRMRALDRLAELKQAEMAQSIELTRRGRVEEARREVASGYGRRLMDEIRQVMNELTTAQRSILAERQAAVLQSDRQGAQSIYRLAALGIALLLAAMVSIIALAYMVYRTKLAVEREAAGEVQRLTLERAVEKRTEQLTEANASLRAEIETRVQTEERLRQAHRMAAVGQLTGGIAHDFNNMLAVVISSLELLKRRVDGTDNRLHKLIDNARDGANRAATLTSRLLAFSRQQSLSPETTDINRLVADVLDLLRRTLGEQIRIVTEFGDDLPFVFVDTAELENAVINLAANARDAMADGGTLTLRTWRADALPEGSGDGGTGSYAVISVVDTGEGMSPDVTARVFEPFFTTKPVGRGTGLGLSQVHGFLHQSGGRIEIQSAPGEGTRVDLYLPEQTGSFMPATKFPDSEAPVPAANGEAVLVVEDEVQLRLLTVDMLRDLGYAVRHASNGAEALRLLGDQAFDLLVTDIIMPDMRGDELARTALAQRPQLRLLYVSGHVRSPREPDAVLDPPADLVRKPFTARTLATRVRQTLDRPATTLRPAIVASQVSGS